MILYYIILYNDIICDICGNVYNHNSNRLSYVIREMDNFYIVTHDTCNIDNID